MNSEKINLDLEKVKTSFFSIALISPDIPQNTGNIARLCLATNCQLVLVRPLGFRLTDSQLQRAGMDYWEKLDPLILDSLEEFFAWAKGKRCFFLSAKGTRSHFSPQYRRGDVFCLGAESSGLPPDTMALGEGAESLIRIPMIEGVRCLNVASSAAVIVYEGLRQILFKSE